MIGFAVGTVGASVGTAMFNVGTVGTGREDMNSISSQPVLTAPTLKKEVHTAAPTVPTAKPSAC